MMKKGNKRTHRHSRLLEMLVVGKRLNAEETAGKQSAQIRERTTERGIEDEEDKKQFSRCSKFRRGPCILFYLFLPCIFVGGWAVVTGRRISLYVTLMG